MKIITVACVWHWQQVQLTDAQSVDDTLNVNQQNRSALYFYLKLISLLRQIE